MPGWTLNIEKTWNGLISYCHAWGDDMFFKIQVINRIQYLHQLTFHFISSQNLVVKTIIMQ